MKTIMITGMPGCGMREVGTGLVTTPGLFMPQYKMHRYDVGNMMYDIDILGHPRPLPTREQWEDKILDAPRSALAALRKAVFKTITEKQTTLQEREESRESVTNNVVLVFVHATFFWRHDLQIGTPFASVEELDPDFFVTVVDDIERIARELYRQKRWQNLSLEEVLWWRAVETTTTAAVASALRRPHYVLARDEDIRTLGNLIAHSPPEMKCVYTSYPISHVGIEQLEQSQEFIEELRKHFIVFDPLKIRDVEYGLEQLFEDYDEDLAIEINKADAQELMTLRGLGAMLAQRIVEYRSTHGPFETVGDITNVIGIGSRLFQMWESRIYVDKPLRKFDQEQLKRVQKQLHHQTASRDYDLIDQSDYVMVHYTKTALEAELQERMGRSEIMPLSPGVICEMKHAYTHHKKVYAVWQSETDPSPFFDFYCTAWERTKEALLSFLRDEGVIAD